MAQQRPAWFRFAGFSLRPSAPAPAPAPAPTPPLVRPSIPIRAPLAPTQTQEPAPSLPQSAASSLPPTAPPSPPPPPRTTLATPAPPTRPPVAQRQRSPFVPPAPQPSPVRAPVAASPTAAPAPKSPTPAPLPTFASPKVIPSSAKTTSPVPKPVETDNGKALSPKMKPLSRSSFALPPTKMEHEPKVEQKTVLVQETIDKPLKNMHDARNYGGIASNGKREPTKKDHKDTSKKLSDSEERGMRLVTLAGENRGAVMELSASSHKKTYTVGNDHPLQKNKNDKSSSESGEEGKSNKKDETNKAMKMRSLPVTAFFNSNVQGVNNSIVHNSTHRHNDPGIRLSLTGKPKNGDRRHHG